MNANSLSLFSLILKFSDHFTNSSGRLLRIKPALYQACLSLMIIGAVCSDSFAQIRIVADLNPSGSDEVYSPVRTFPRHVSSATRSFFISKQGYGDELWTSDGTETGTRLLKFSRTIADLAVSGSVAFFSAQTDEHGTELWKSDGTPEGTVMVKDIFPGGGSSSPLWLTDVDGTLFFSANNSTNGRELWTSDGTTSGTQMVMDVKSGNGSSGVAMITAFGNTALFVADNGVVGYELWKSDGTASGTALLADINPSGNSSPSDITVANGVVFFAAEAPSTNRQLYKTDGTTAGTSLVKVIRPGNYNARITNITAVGGVVFFEAFDAAHGAELWKSDGTSAGTMLVRDITPGSGSPASDGSRHVDHLAEVDGKLFFTAIQDYYRQLWVSDGTAGGTVVPEFTSGEWDSFSLKTDPGIADLNGDALFLGMTQFSSRVSLLKSDGVSTTMIKHDLAFCACEIETTEIPGPPSPQFVGVQGEFYFFAGNQYWKTDGTTAGTALIRDLSFRSGIGEAVLTDLNGTLLFYAAETGTGTNGLFKTNGSPETTSHISDAWSIDQMTTYNGLSYFGSSSLTEFRPTPHRTDGTASGTIALNTGLIWPSRFTGSQGLMFFHAQGPSGSELYRSDGTPSGTVLVKDIYPGAENHSHPLELTDVANTLFFSAETAEHGRELWKSDGTSAGTVLVKDIAAGTASSNISNGRSYNGHYYFMANDGVNGFQLWRSNGTAIGTVIVSSFPSGSIRAASAITKVNGLFFFSTWNLDGTVSLWRGSPSNIMKLRDFDAGGTNSISFLASEGENILFLVKQGADTDLWKSNGTVTGTLRVRKFRSTPLWFASSAVRNNITYFGLGGTVWRTDGTGPGTFSLPFYGQTSQFTTSGSYVYFFGESADYGSELFLIEDETSSGTSITKAAEFSVEGGAISGFPNPFRSTLTLRVNGGDRDEFRMSVLDSRGQEIVRESDFACNIDHTLGAAWGQGMYFLRIRHGNVTSVKKVVKDAN